MQPSHRLNLERRRKRIRHYLQQRRRRSPFHRAFTYWWSTAVLGTVTLLMLGSAVPGLPGCTPHHPVLDRPPEARAAGLTLIHASEKDISAIVRQGNVHRIALALSDQDIGISLTPPLPPLPPVSPHSVDVYAPIRHRPGAIAPPPPTLPPAYEPKTRPAASPTLSILTDAALKSAEFCPEMPETPVLNRVLAGLRSPAEFTIELDRQGLPVTVLRRSPEGDETEALRLLRSHLLTLRGRRAARGTVRFIPSAVRLTPSTEVAP